MGVVTSVVSVLSEGLDGDPRLNRSVRFCKPAIGCYQIMSQYSMGEGEGYWTLLMSYCSDSSDVLLVDIDNHRAVKYANVMNDDIMVSDIFSDDDEVRMMMNLNWHHCVYDIPTMLPSAVQ